MPKKYLWCVYFQLPIGLFHLDVHRWLKHSLELIIICHFASEISLIHPLLTALMHPLFLIHVPPRASRILQSIITPAKRFICLKNKFNYIILLLKNFHWLLWFKRSFGCSDLINTTSTEELWNLEKKKERKKDRERRKKKTQGTMKVRLTKHKEAYEYLHRSHWSWDRENNSVFYLIKRSILFS